MHYAQMTSRRRRPGGQGSGRTRPHLQRCAVRVTYTKNSTRGQWRAHGRYVTRESATHEGDPRAVGFNATEESIDIAARLEVWQKANDERLWKLTVSPEFGDRVDLKRLTRDLISQMETDLGTRLEWMPAAHFNNEHPHVHIALRGVGAESRPLRLSGDFIREGIRHITENFVRAPAWVSDRIGCRRCATSRGTPTSLHFTGPDHPAECRQSRSVWVPILRSDPGPKPREA